jgi:molecular chaperone GrpE
MTKDRNDNKDKNKNNENKIEIERSKKDEKQKDVDKSEAPKIEEKQNVEIQKSIEEIFSNEIIDLKKKNEALQKEVNEYKDKLLRKAAEFENFKRRTENDQLNLITYAAESFILKILPVFDDMERSFLHIDDENTPVAVKEGLKMVFNKFSKILEEQGIKKIEAKGKPFDVNFHEAMLQKRIEGVEPNIVLEEVEAGYMYKDKIIRHTKVIVSDDGSSAA